MVNFKRLITTLTFATAAFLTLLTVPAQEVFAEDTLQTIFKAEWKSATEICLSTESDGNMAGFKVKNWNGCYQTKDEFAKLSTGSITTYILNPHPGSCKVDTLDDAVNSASVILHEAGRETVDIRLAFFRDEDSTCVRTDQVTIPLESGPEGASAIIGKWVNENTIQNNLDGATYKQSSTNAVNFISQADGQGDCKDIIVIKGDHSSGHTLVDFFDQKSGSGSPISSSCGIDRSMTNMLISESTNKELPGTEDEEGASAPPSCESEGRNFGWIMCWIVEDLIMNGLNQFSDFVQGRLDVEIQDQDSVRAAWSSMRSIANVLFVVALLAIIVSQALTGRF